MHSILLNMFIIKKTCHFNLGNVLDICQGSQIRVVKVSFALQIYSMSQHVPNPTTH